MVGQTSQQSLDSGYFELVSSHQQEICITCLAHHLALYTHGEPECMWFCDIRTCTFVCGCMRSLLNDLQENQNSWPFLEPVNEQQGPEYAKLIKFPMGKCSVHCQTMVNYISIHVVYTIVSFYHEGAPNL